MAHPSPHRERLVVPWWAWPLAPLCGAVLGAELTLGAPELRIPAISVGLALCLAGVVWLSRIVVRVEDGQLRVDDATLPLRFMAGATALDAAGKRDLLGPDAQALAFVILRPWLAGAVRVDLDDPADPTPYWLISSRRPESLAAALHASATADERAPGVSDR